MSKKSVTELLGRWAMLKTTRAMHENTWDEIVHLMQPFRGDIRTKHSEGTKRVSAVFDSTAMQQADAFVNFLKGSLIPAGSDWIRLRPARRYTDRDDMYEDQEYMNIKRALDATSDRVMTALSNSNFYIESAAFLKDFSVLGNGTMHVRWDDDYHGQGYGGLCFEAVPIMRAWWQNGRKNRPFFIVREFEMAAIDADKFFEGNSPTAAECLRRNRAFEKVEFAHFVFENEHGKVGSLVSAENKPWTSVYVDCTAHKDIQFGGFNFCPYIVSRWMVVDGEEYGRGRGHLARPDAKGANEIRAQMLLAAGRALDPPLVMEEDSLIEGDVAPGGTLYVRPWQKQAPDYLRAGTDLSVAQEMLLQDRAMIQKAFLGDLFEDPETQPRSAEESRQRLERARQRLAAPAEAIDYDFATPLMETVIGLLRMEKQLPELDELFEEYQEGEFEIVFQSPFFTAQKNSQVQRVYSFVTRRVGLFQALQDPSWIDDLDPDKIRKLDAELSDVSADIFRAEEDIELRRQSRAAKEAEQRMQSLAGQGPGPGRPPAGRNPIPAQQIEETY